MGLLSQNIPKIPQIPHLKKSWISIENVYFLGTASDINIWLGLFIISITENLPHILISKLIQTDGWYGSLNTWKATYYELKDGRSEKWIYFSGTASNINIWLGKYNRRKGILNRPESFRFVLWVTSKTLECLTKAKN